MPVQETRVQSRDGEDPLEKECLPAPVLLPGEPMDGGARRAAVRGAAESRTR